MRFVAPFRLSQCIAISCILLSFSSSDVALCEIEKGGEGSAPPNVLFLVVDDMKDWVNCLGGYAGTVHTPNIDRLANRGILFTNAHCPSPKCAPSRAAVLTGLMPSTTGLYDNGHWWLPNLPHAVSIPAHFRNSGYEVIGAGKIFHHTAGNHPPNQWSSFRRITFKNDPWFRGAEINYPWSRHGPYPEEFPFSGVKGLGHENDWGALPIDAREYDDSFTCDFAIEFLQKRSVTVGNKPVPERSQPPFFLACGVFRPHLPWYVPQEFFDMYELEEVVLPEILPDDLGDVPEGGVAFAHARKSDFETIKTADRWREAVRAYLASISYADSQLGRVLDALDASGTAEDTIIVLWSDHGWHLGEKGHWHKSTLWEEATRVPLVICVPGHPPAVCDAPVSLVDLYPTLVEVTGLQLKNAQTLDGTSLVPLLSKPATPSWDRPAIVEYKRGNAAVRSRRYRYIRYSGGGEELYDHASDPNEWHNLISGDAIRTEHAKVQRELASWIAKEWAPVAPTKREFEFDPVTFTWTHKKTGQKTFGK